MGPSLAIWTVTTRQSPSANFLQDRRGAPSSKHQLKRADQAPIPAESLRTLNKAGIDKPGGIHTLRHCYATGLLEAGVELHVIQRRLGHSSIRSTMRYLHLAHDKTSSTPSPLDLLEFPQTGQS